MTSLNLNADDKELKTLAKTTHKARDIQINLSISNRLKAESTVNDADKSSLCYQDDSHDLKSSTLFKNDLPFIPREESKKDLFYLLAEEVIWGQFIFKDASPTLSFLEFLNTAAGSYTMYFESQTYDPPKEVIDIFEHKNSKYNDQKLAFSRIASVCLLLNKPLRLMLYHNVLEQPCFEQNDSSLWKKWFNTFCVQNQLTPTDDEKYLEFLKQAFNSNFAKFKELYFMLRALSFEIDSNKRSTSIFLFPFCLDAIYADTQNMTSKDDRFFKGSGQMLFLMLQRILTTNVNKLSYDDCQSLLQVSHQTSKDDVQRCLDSMRKRICINLNNKFFNQDIPALQPFTKLIRLFSLPFFESNHKPYDELYDMSAGKFAALSSKGNYDLKFFPCTYDPLFYQMAEDVDFILSSKLLPFEMFDVLSIIMNLYLLRYICKRSTDVHKAVIQQKLALQKSNYSDLNLAANMAIHITANKDEAESYDESSLASNSTSENTAQQSSQEPDYDLDQGLSLKPYPYLCFIVEGSPDAQLKQVRACSQRMYTNHFKYIFSDVCKLYVQYEITNSAIKLSQEKPEAYPLEQILHGTLQKDTLNALMENFVHGISFIRCDDRANLINHVSVNSPDNFNKLVSVLTDEPLNRKRSNDHTLFKNLATNIGLLSKDQSNSFRFILSDKLLKALVLVILKHETSMRDQEFFQQLYQRFGIIVRNNEFKDMKTCYNQHLHCEEDSLNANLRALCKRMVQLNLCNEQPDSSIRYILNPFSLNINHEKTTFN